jgi:hypothetical protein
MIRRRDPGHFGLSSWIFVCSLVSNMRVKIKLLGQSSLLYFYFARS